MSQVQGKKKIGIITAKMLRLSGYKGCHHVFLARDLGLIIILK